jgi:hypothetical protein
VLETHFRVAVFLSYTQVHLLRRWVRSLMEATRSGHRSSGDAEARSVLRSAGMSVATQQCSTPESPDTRFTSPC